MMYLLIALQIQDPPTVKAEREATKAAKGKLEHLVAYSFEKAALRSVVEIIGKETGVNTLVEYDVTGTATINVQNVAASKALEDVATQAGAAVVMYHGIAVVCKKDDKGRPTFVAEGLPGPWAADIDPDKLKGKAADAAHVLTVNSGDVEFDKTPFKDVVAFIAEQSELEITLDGEWKDTATISWKLTDVPLHVVLRLACRHFGADWKIEESGKVKIGPKKP
jgi:type II secretory pathway component GspD/PulD (secretin)